MQRRGTVHQHGVSLDDVLQDAPDHRILAVDDLFGGFHRLHDATLDQLTDHERLVEFRRHIFGDTHLVHLQLRTDDDHRTRRIVDTLTQQILTETSLFTFQRVGEGFQSPVAFVLHRVALARVIEERIDSLLQHTFLVTQNDLGSLDLDEAFQAVVANDDAAIEVVQVRRGKTSAIQGHQRTQFGWDHGQCLQHHPFGFVLTLRRTEHFDHVEAFQRLAFTLLRSLDTCFVTQCVRHFIQLHLLQQRVYRFGTHLGDELIRIVIRQLLVLLGEGGQNIEILLFGEGLQALHAGLFGSTGIDHHIAFVIDDRLQFFGRDTQQVTDLGRQRAEVPDVHHRHDEGDVSHSFATHLFLRHLDTATVAHDPLVTDPLVLSAVALIILHGTENAFAKQSVAFGFIGTVVDRFGFEHLAAGLCQNLLGRRQSNRDRAVTAIHIQCHIFELLSILS